MALCFSDEYTCATETRPGTGTPGAGTPETGTPGTEIGASGTTTNIPVTPTKSRNKALPIAIGIGSPIFVIFCAVVTFLAIDHQKRKALAEAAEGQTNEIYGPAMPVYEDTEKQTQPMVKSI
ncbi:hypothetical protein MKW92_017698 [Papaver armeniacum]|nr:hypothetical protein MKW92_017698 [Papaver armeniacum]